MSVQKTNLVGRLMLIALLFIGNLKVYGQKKSTITGEIKDQQNKSIGYATVLLYKQQDSVFIKSLLSDSLGRFLFPDIDRGSYKIKVSSIGYVEYVLQNIEVLEPKVVLSEPIVLKTNKKILADVRVTASRSFVEQKVDKLVVNVSNSATSAGATALEILQKVPGVIIINGHVNLAGKTGVVIMIDGKPSPYTDLEALLKDIPGNNIDKVEVISNPGSQYEASGSAGIINLVLKKNKKTGWTGSYVLGTGYSFYNQKEVQSNDHSYNRYSGSLSLNYKNKKWNFFGSADFLHRSVFEVNNFDRTIGNTIFVQKNYYPYFYNTVNYRVGIDYYSSKKSTIGILINGNQRSGHGTSTTYTSVNDLHTNNFINGFITNNLTNINRFNLTGNLNYTYKIDTTGNVINADLDYSGYKYKNTADIKIPTSNTSYFQLGQNPLNYLTLKANYTHPFANAAKLDVGFKLSEVDISNNLLFTRNLIIDSSQTNRFKYKEAVQAAYISLGKKWETFEYLIGLRAEYTSTRGELSDVNVLNRKYLQLFPSVSLSQKLTKAWNLNFAYSRRIDRPQFVLLSPFSYYIDSLTYSKGNSNLSPQLTHAAKLTFRYNNSCFIAINYNHTSNTIFENAPQQIGNVTYTQPDNLGTHDNIVTEINIPVAIGSFITGYGDFQGIFNRYNTSYLNSIYRKNNFSYQSNINVSLKISQTLKAEINAFYTSGTLNEFMSISSFSGVNLALQKSILNNKGKLSFSANDIFYKNSTVSIVNYKFINTRYFYRDDSRNFRLTFSYSFGGDKASKDPVHEIGSKEENNRLHN